MEGGGGGEVISFSLHYWAEIFMYMSVQVYTVQAVTIQLRVYLGGQCVNVWMTLQSRCNYRVRERT